jgi:putative urate catabolism protein
VGADAYKGARHMNMESIYEFGSRAGFWRLHREFTQRKMLVTSFAVARAMELNPEAVKAMQKADWEIASHGYRWIDYQFMNEDEERDHIKKAIQIHKDVTGEEPQGWYIGRCSPNSRRLLLEETTPVYDADSYADELPYYIDVNGKNHLVVPYTLDCNDMRFATNQGFNSGEQFFQYMKDTFDVLYEEGNETPKMMSVGLHCRLVGRPGRMAALKRFLDYIETKKYVWVCRRIDIANHWRDHVKN